MTNRVDVLVVGAGPTGSVLAIDLVRRGQSVRLIDKSSQSFPGSRAKGLQPRTLEMLQDLGALDSVLEAGSLYPPLGVHMGPLTLPKRMYKTNRASDDIPYPNTWLIPQYRTDAILHQRLAEFGGVVEYNSKLTGFQQDQSAVRATIEGPDGTECIDCGYLVGADGGASTVREALGIGFPGKTDESDRMIIVDCKVDGLSRKYWHAWTGKKGRFTVACPLPGGDLFQWMIQLRSGDEPDLDETKLNSLIRRHTKSDNIRLHDIRWTSVFRPNIRLAEDYRKGRVFLAGDAAHVHTPMGAQGLNTGVQDAYNLGWKLAQVLQGAPSELLNTYEAERQPIAASVLGRSTKKYEAAAANDAESTKRGKDEQQLLITYRAGPLGKAGAESTATLEVGDRAPDAVLRQEQGGEIRLFDLYKGIHFTAIAYGGDAAWRLSRLDWAEIGAPLKRIAINCGAVPGIAMTMQDPKGSFKNAYGIEEDTILLVRPDGYLAQISVKDHGALQKTIARLTP